MIVPMLLVLDAGNTNLTIGLAEDGRLLAIRRVRTNPDATADELELQLDGLLRLDGHGLHDVDRVIAASVVPSIEPVLAAVAARRRLALVAAGPGSVPMAIRTENPAEVGPDRLVNAFAAARLHGAPAIVVDLGTATTLDVVAADGAFVGGAIAAGVGLGVEALASRTARLGAVDLQRPARAIGRNTREAMQSGAVFGSLAMLRGLIDRVASELASGAPGVRPHVILTGGLSRLPWVRELEGVDAIDPDLTVKGLVLLDLARQSTGAGAGASRTGAVASGTESPAGSASQPGRSGGAR
jgi:type III pantothenate kinase